MNYEALNNKLRLWEKNVSDKALSKELNEIKNNKSLFVDAFYKDLEFGTGGLRGVIGVGTNRMNIYTVGKASQGLADYILKHFSENTRSIAISYDSRRKSKEFARFSAEVFAANGIKVFIYQQLMPTPCLSFAVRYLNCSAGIMITASHNPAKYNGYKVYGSDGCQIITEAVAEIQKEINKLDIFNDIRRTGFDVAIKQGSISYIQEEVYTAFVEEVKKQSVLFGDEIDRNVSIVYSPLNGTGLKPVLRVLQESGFTNIKVVKEQENPDGNFPTCPYPNPEIKEAMQLGIEYAKKYDADLLLATDPDCDRAGIAVRDESGEMKLLSGNETGLLLLDYICNQRVKHNKMPKDPVLVKTIVTIDMAERIANEYGVKTVNVLTGFKFIGEQIGLLEKQGKQDNYIFGFEESYGYLSGIYVRDKDAVNATFLICEMLAYYKTSKIGLLDKLNELYNKYGYCLNTLNSYEFEGVEGLKKMQKIMQIFRFGIKEIAGKKILKRLDYSLGIDSLPKSDVLKFILEDNCTIVLRPSGTEPKLKAYISCYASSKNEATNNLTKISRYIDGSCNV